MTYPLYWLRANIKTPPALWSDANDVFIVPIVAVKDQRASEGWPGAMRKQAALGVPAGSRKLPAAPAIGAGIDGGARAVAEPQGVAA